MTNFRSVVLDVDSTLCGVEGIDWLAERRGEPVSSEVTALTRKTMEGEIALDAVYGKRLDIVAPTRADVSALGDEYARTIAPGAASAVGAMMKRGITVHLISGGLLPAVRKAGAAVGIPDGNIHAVEIYFDGEGNYLSFDGESPLTRKDGKRALIASLALHRPSLMVGDGVTDAEAKPAVDAFAAFTLFATRPKVVAAANHVLSNYDDLLKLVSE